MMAISVLRTSDDTAIVDGECSQNHPAKRRLTHRLQPNASIWLSMARGSPRCA